MEKFDTEFKFGVGNGENMKVASIFFVFLKSINYNTLILNVICFRFHLLLSIFFLFARKFPV